MNCEAEIRRKIDVSAVYNTFSAGLIYPYRV
jgi:hypothetical protein